MPNRSVYKEPDSHSLTSESELNIQISLTDSWAAILIAVAISQL